MLLEGSCHCKDVTFTVEAGAPVPFMRCYCSICRKTAGAGGYAVNLGAEFASLKVQGAAHIRVYRARGVDPVTGVRAESPAERSFCGTCGSPLWLYDARWPGQVHPHAGAIDSPLPVPAESWHIMLDGKPDWVEVALREGDRQFDGYPDLSLAEWHETRGFAL